MFCYETADDKKVVLYKIGTSSVSSACILSTQAQLHLLVAYVLTFSITYVINGA